MNKFWIVRKGLGKKKKKTSKQYSGLTSESFSNHQNNPLLNSAFLEGLDVDLTTLVKRQCRLVQVIHKHLLH